MNIESLTSPSKLRWFPWKLYAYVFGAAFFGWGAGNGMAEPSPWSLAALVIGCLLCVIGFFGMRPYMRAAEVSVRLMADARTESEVSK